MNNEELKKEVVGMIDSLTCTTLSDEQYCRHHRAVLTLIADAIKAGRLFLPTELYCKYKGYVELSEMWYRKTLADNRTNINPKDLHQMYHCYRQQTETNYRMMCRLIVSTCHNTTLPEEREVLENIINGIRQLKEQAIK